MAMFCKNGCNQSIFAFYTTGYFALSSSTPSLHHLTYHVPANAARKAAVKPHYQYPTLCRCVLQDLSVSCSTYCSRSIQLADTSSPSEGYSCYFEILFIYDHWQAADYFTHTRRPRKSVHAFRSHSTFFNLINFIKSLHQSTDVKAKTVKNYSDCGMLHSHKLGASPCSKSFSVRV